MQKDSLLIALSLALYNRVSRHRNVLTFIFLLWLIPFNLFAGGPVFVITPDTINFGVLNVGDYKTRRLNVYNGGDGNGLISLGDITGPGSNFIYWIPGVSWIIGVGSFLSISIPCNASAPGIINATGTIYTDDPQLPVFYVHFIGTIVPVGFALSGLITYPNRSATPLTGLMVKLKDVNGTVVNTVMTNNFGQYLFSNVQNGNYTLEVLTTKPWGGVTAVDVLLYKKHIAGIASLNGIFLVSGDVNDSGTLSALDVLLIKKRIAGMSNSFPTGDWLFNTQTITINGFNVTQNFNGICYGDANGSYVPPSNNLSLGPGCRQPARH